MAILIFYDIDTFTWKSEYTLLSQIMEKANQLWNIQVFERMAKKHIFGVYKPNKQCEILHYQTYTVDLTY